MHAAAIPDVSKTTSICLLPKQQSATLHLACMRGGTTRATTTAEMTIVVCL
jgi:hypothetical protein